MEENEHQGGFLNKISNALFSKWPYFLVVLFGLIITMGVWVLGNQVLLGDDYAFHTMRMQSASRAWANGQLIPQVDPSALDGFGYAYNIFYGPLVTYIAAAAQAVIGVWPIALNVTLVVLVLAAGLTMCHAMLKISKNQALAFIVGVIYITAPYFLNNLYSRMALGEVTAAVAAPILLLSLYQLTAHHKHAARNIAISAAMLILSHSLSAMLFALMGVIYILLNLRRLFDWESIWRMVLGGAVALGLSAFFTLPMLEARLVGIYGVFDEKYLEVYFGANAQSVNDHRLWPQQLLAVGDDALMSSNGEYNIMLGIMLLVGVFGFWFVRKTVVDDDERRFVRSLYIIGLLAILITLPLMDWQFLPSVMLQIQFPWRFLMVAVTALSVVSGYTILAVARQLAREQQAVVAIMVGIAAVYVVMPQILPNPEQHLVGDIETVADDAVSIGWQAEYAPVQLLCSSDAEEDILQGYACSLTRIRERLAERGDGVEVLNGEVRLTKMQKDGLNIEFFAENAGENEALVELPLIYYPGYQATLDGEELLISHSSENGLVTIVIPVDSAGEVKVWYGMSYATRIGVIISMVTAGLGLIWVIISGIQTLRYGKKDAEMARLMDSMREVVEDSPIDLGEPVDPPIGLPMMPQIVSSATLGDNNETTTNDAKKTTVKKPKRTKPQDTTDQPAQVKTAKRKTKEKTAEIRPKVTKVRASSRTKKDPE